MSIIDKFLPSTWVRYLVVALVVTAAIGGSAAWCYHNGTVHEGERRDALDAQVTRDRAASFGRALDAGRTATQLYLAEKRNREFLQGKLQRKITNARESDLAVCNSTEPVGRDTDRPACVFTRYYVGLWNDGWSGSDRAEPVQGDSAGTSPEEREATALGPRDILKNEQVNAASCTDDRARLDRLVDLIPRLSAEWDRSHKQ